MNATPEDFNHPHTEDCPAPPRGVAAKAQQAAHDPLAELRRAALEIRPNDSAKARWLMTGPWSPAEQNILAGRTPWTPRETDMSGRGELLRSWLVTDGWPSHEFLGLLPKTSDAEEPWMRSVGASVRARQGEHHPETFSAERWLRRSDSEYAARSQSWRHVRRGDGIYRVPREVEAILSPVACESGQDAPLNVVADNASSHVLPEPKPEPEWPSWAAEVIERVNREARKRNRAEHEIRCGCLPIETLRRPRKLYFTPVVGVGDLLAEYVETPGNGRAKQRAWTRLDKASRDAAILWDWKHPEALAARLGIKKLTREALARWHGVSRDTVERLTNHLEAVMNDTPTLIERVAELERLEPRVVELDRQIGLPVGGDEAIKRAIERVIAESYEGQKAA
jgi:hypothetical protein